MDIGSIGDPGKAWDGGRGEGILRSSLGTSAQSCSGVWCKTVLVCASSSDQPLPCFLLAEQSTMTTESGSDSESKPDQEAEPQEAAGPQEQAGAQAAPEPAGGNVEEQPGLEQFPEAAAHSTPVKREVSLGHLWGRPTWLSRAACCQPYCEGHLPLPSHQRDNGGAIEGFQCVASLHRPTTALIHPTFDKKLHSAELP